MRSPLFDQRNSEIQSPDRWTQQSSKMVRVVVAPDSPVIATKGAMVAYQGQMSFSHQGAGGVGKFLKKHLTGEDTPLMRVEGAGEVFFARDASEIFLMHLEGPNDGLSVNSSSLLAFDPSLEEDVKRVKGAGAASGSGLFNVELRGVGTVALRSKGNPLILDCSQQPTYVDPEAVVCWSANLQPTIHTDISFGSFIGRGGGESFQMLFQGPGFVVVQPAENYAGGAGSSSGSSGGSGFEFNFGD